MRDKLCVWVGNMKFIYIVNAHLESHWIITVYVLNDFHTHEYKRYSGIPAMRMIFKLV